MTYLWFKALHLIGVITWLAGLFYIWRLFVYHVESPSAEVRAQLLIMAQRLSRYIMRPAAVVAIGFGFLLLYRGWHGYTQSIWIWIKLAFVFGMFANHGRSEYYLRRLAAGETFASSKRFRVLNEVPTVLMIFIVLLAVLKDSLWS